MVHELKILSKYFIDVLCNHKTFEVRYNDRNYKVGDVLVLYEYSNGEYTGSKIYADIKYVLPLDAFGIVDYVVMSIEVGSIEIML